MDQNKRLKRAAFFAVDLIVMLTAFVFMHCNPNDKEIVPGVAQALGGVAFRERRPHALIIPGIGFFKNDNDMIGRLQCDACLGEMAV